MFEDGVRFELGVEFSSCLVRDWRFLGWERQILSDGGQEPK
jgi:hypothetical protein